ncbi:MAG: Sua5 family C-terminal domain-containing protein [Actinomycetes bacterium]
MEALARSLYRFLREADSLSLDRLVVSLPPETGLGLAVADRLRRAAHS